MELWLFAAEILLAAYLYRKRRILSGKEKDIASRMSFIQSRRESLERQEEILREDFA